MSLVDGSHLKLPLSEFRPLADRAAGQLLKKREQKQFIYTVNRILLCRELVGEARDQLEMQTGIFLTQSQLIGLMEDNGLDLILGELDEAGTKIRDILANNLSLVLIGRSWPTSKGLLNLCNKSETNFADDLNEAAERAGYIVRW